jgi:hypothetical protein
MAPDDLRSRVLPGTAWGSAGIQAQDALANAAGHLRRHSGRRRVGGRRRAAGVAARSELARRLDATAVTLTAGRDLLNTHLTRDPDGARQVRSEWALVSCSPPARQALLAELPSLARQITPPCRSSAPASRTRNGPARYQLPTVTCCAPSRSTPRCHDRC